MDLTVHKAEPIGTKRVESVTLRIEASLPKTRTLGDAGDVYLDDARSVMQALRALPQGTRHRLLGLLLADHSNLFAGP